MSVSVDEDLRLLECWRGGDSAAGERLCTRYFEEIYRFFEHKIPAEADDLTQQTFLACIKARDQFRGMSSFRTFLFAIARNMFYTYLRQKPANHQVDLDVSSLDDLVAPSSQQLGRQLDQGHELAAIRAALRRLPVAQQVLLEFRYWHDLDAAALAEMFQSTPGAIRIKLLRARRALQAQLQALGESPPASDPLSSSLHDPEIERDPEQET